MQDRRTSAVWALCFLMGTMAAFGQVNTATITGTITDPTNSAVANVQVTVIQTETQFTSVATTNAQGLYRVPSLQPGTYQLTFEAPGFKRLVREGIALRVGDVLPVNISLELGSVNDSVEVSAQGTLLQTEQSSTGTVAEGDALYKLPLYQRSINNSMIVLPAVGVTASGPAQGLNTYSIAGQRSTGTAVYEDGVFGVDPLASTNSDVRPIENSVEEVKVLTSTLPAEYGHSAGGVVTVVKKGGTNSFHGMAADFGRSRMMTHRQFFNLYKTSQVQPGAPTGVPGWFMQPDANASGPIVIPHLYNGRNRTFFFFGYQKLIDKHSVATTSLTPTPDELSGDFTFGGVGNALYDPATTRQLADGTWTRDPFPSRVITQSRVDPVAARIIGMNIWLPPNAPGSFTSTGPTSNFMWESTMRTFQEDYSGRVDHQISQNFKLYGSYSYDHASGHGRPTNIVNPVFDGNNGALTPSTQQNYSIGATKVINPTTLNDLRIGYYRARNDSFVPSYHGGWAQKLGIPNVSPALLPAFGASFSSSTGGIYNTGPVSSIYGLTTTGPTRNIRETLSFRDDFSKALGMHAFKMGYEVLDFRANYWQVGQPSGQFAFDTMTAGLQGSGQPLPNTGNDFAGFMLGSTRADTFSLYTTTWLPRDQIHSAYFQDDWKVSQNLTLNLGLRFSTESPYHMAHGMVSNFNPTATDPVTGKPGAIVHPTGGLNSRAADFQPRVGMAWHPLNKWVFRGGFGLNTIDIRWPNAAQQFDEYQALSVQQRAPGDPRPLFQLSNGPSPVQYNILANGSAPYVGTNYGSRNITWMDPQLRPGYAMNWNLTTEYQISTNYVVKLTYQGSAGVHLVESWNVNVFPTSFGANNAALRAAAFAATQNYLPYPQFGKISYMSNTGHSSYHSGTVAFERRYSKGFVFSSFFMLSKALDDCDSDVGSCTGVAPVENRNLNKGRAGFDMNQRFVASATYELPIGKGRHFMNHGGILNWLIGGYDLAWIQTVETGNPLSFSFINSPSNYYSTTIGNWVPNVVGKPSMRSGWRDMGPNRFNQALENAAINVSYFTYPAAFTPGNAGRNIVTGPGAYYSLASAKKNFALSERFNLQLRFDFQNPFHNFSFNPPVTVVDFKNPQLFGKITGDAPTANTAGQPLMNLMLRLNW